MRDLTVVFYTANYIREPFGAYVRGQLLRSIGDLPLISVSHKPMDFGHNICVGDIGRSPINIYRQILMGAREADTPWIALAEDDVLYPPDHFEYRPTGEDLVAYNMHRWAIYTWMHPPTFFASSGRHTIGMIASRRLVIEALEERYAKYPDDTKIPLSLWGEIGRVERRLNITIRKVEDFSSRNPIVVFFHEDAIGFQYLGTRKYRPPTRALEIPYWGRAAELQKEWEGK